MDETNEVIDVIGTNFVQSYLSINENEASSQEKDSENISYEDNSSNYPAHGMKISLIESLMYKAQNSSYSKSNEHEIIDMNSNKYQYANRMILLGPSKSGKSSLVMESACSICSFTTSFSTDLQVSSKRVTYLMHSSQRQQNKFPLKCRCSISSIKQNNICDNIENDVDISAKEKKLAMMAKIFEKIDIHYVSTIDDLIRFLSIIPLLPLDKRPSGGIIFDDLYLFFIQHNVTRNIIDDDMMMKLLQLLALISSTANYLDYEQSNKSKSLKYKPISIIITWDTSVIALPRHMQQMISNYIPYFAIVYQDHSDDTKQDKIERKPASRWRVYLHYHQGSTHDITSMPNKGSIRNNFSTASYQIYIKSKDNGNEKLIGRGCYDHNLHDDDNIVIWKID